MQRISIFFHLIVTAYSSVSAFIRCSHYLSGSTNMHSFELRADHDAPGTWVAQHTGEIFGQILVNNDLSMDIKEDGTSVVGKCLRGGKGKKGSKGKKRGSKGSKAVLDTLLTCDWPERNATGRAESRHGSIKFDRQSKLATVVVNGKPLSSSRAIWGNAWRKSIVFDKNPYEILDDVRAAIVKHFIRIIPTYTICLGTDNPASLETAKRDALLFASMAVAYQNTEKWLSVE